MTDTAQLGRFGIRDLHPWEGPALFALTGDPEVMRYIGFPLHKSVNEATALISQYQKSQARYKAVCSLEGGEVLGVFGMEIVRHSVTLTIMFRRNWKARGAGREFSKPLVQWIFTHPGIWRVWAYCHVDNVPVQRVLERMGAEREGRMRRFEVFPNVSTEPQDCYLYAITR